MNRFYTTASALLLLGLTTAAQQVGPGETAPPDPGTMTPFETVPAQNAELSTTSPLETISIRYNGGGDDGLEKLWRAGKTIDVMRDGVCVQEINCEDFEALSYDPRYPGGYIITLTPITEPGKYSIEIPGGLAEVAADKFNTTPEEILAKRPSRVSAAYTLNFTISEHPDFQMSPMPGKFAPGDLNEFTITYPEGAVITKGAPIVQPMVYNFKVFVSDGDNVWFNQSYVASGVTMDIQGNKVVFSVNENLPSLKENIYSEWYYLMVPKDTYVVELDGQTYPVPPLKFEKYDVRALDEQALTLTPMPEEKEEFLPGELEDVVLYYPDSYTPYTMWCAVGKTAGYLKQTTSPTATTGFNVGTYKIREIDADNHRIYLSFDAPASDEVLNNNPKNFMAGTYAVSINANLFTIAGSTKKSTALTIPGYRLLGKETFGVAMICPVVNGQPTNSNLIDINVGFQTLQMEFPMGVTMVDASGIKLLHNGVEVATPVSVTLDQYMPKMAKLEFAQKYTQKGVYTVVIPEGSFKLQGYGERLNQAQNYNLEAPVQVEYSLLPAGGDVFSKAVVVSEIAEIRIPYAQGITPVVSKLPTLQNVSVTIVDNAGNEEVFYKYYPSSVTSEGQDVVLKFDPAVQIATGSTGNFALRLDIQAGSWRTMEADGMLSINAPKTAYYSILNVIPGQVYAADTEDLADPTIVVGVPGNEEAILPTKLARLCYRPTIQPLNNIVQWGSAAYLCMKGSDQHIYDFKNTYNNISFDADYGVVVMDVHDLSVLNDLKGEVDFVIPSGSCFNFKFSGIYMDQPMVYTFKVADNASGVESADVETLEVTAEGGVVNVSGLAEGEVVNVYSVDGQFLAKSVANQGKATLNPGAKGLVIVCSGNKAKKVIL